MPDSRTYLKGCMKQPKHPESQPFRESSQSIRAKIEDCFEVNGIEREGGHL